MEPLTPLHAGLIVFGAVQLGLAVQLVKRGGWRHPDRAVTSVLFLLNGLISILVGLQQLGGDAPSEVNARLASERVIRVLDVPTNFLLIFVACLLWRRLDQQGWPRWAKVGLVACAIPAGVNAGLVAWQPALDYGLWYHYGFNIVPLAVAWSTLIVVNTVRFVGPSANPPVRSFLLFGWAARPLQVTAQEIEAVTQPALLNMAVHVLMLAAALYCLAAVAITTARRAVKREAAHAWVIVGLVAAVLLGFSLEMFDSQTRAYSAAQLLSLAVIRPVFVGYAYAGPRFLRLLSWAGVATASAILAKAAVGVTFGHDFWTLGTWDYFSALLAALMLGSTIALYSRFRHRHDGSRPNQALLGRATPIVVPAKPAQADRTLLLAAFLLGRLDSWTSKGEIRSATGITEQNTAQYKRRLDLRARRQGVWDQEGPVILETEDRVRKTKRYQLAPGADEAVRRLLDAANSSAKPEDKGR